MPADTLIRVSHETLFRFTRDIFVSLGVPSEDAATAAEVLVHSDILGIDSHGVARLAVHPGYVPGLQRGFIKAVAQPRVERETSSTALLNGDGGLGGVVSTRAMNLAIEKASGTGVGMVTVANSHHFGIACHYAMMALPHGMIGISMTNAAPQVVPTYGKKAMLGTNPLSFAAPTATERPFILDMATSVIAAGKVEIAQRVGKPIPTGWLVDDQGRPTVDGSTLWSGGAILPVGSTPELASHKGYGLAVMVDVLCGVLSGAGFSSILDMPTWDTGHFFVAIDVGSFRSLAGFRAMMDLMIQTLHNAEPAPGAERVYVHGDRELDAEIDRRANGVPLHPAVVESLRSLSRDLGVPFDAD